MVNKNFVWGPRGERLGDDHPGPPLELPLVGGIVPMLLGGINAPGCLISSMYGDRHGIEAWYTGRKRGCHFGHRCSRAVFTGAGPHYP